MTLKLEYVRQLFCTNSLILSELWGCGAWGIRSFSFLLVRKFQSNIKIYINKIWMEAEIKRISLVTFAIEWIYKTKSLHFIKWQMITMNDLTKWIKWKRLLIQIRWSLKLYLKTFCFYINFYQLYMYILHIYLLKYCEIIAYSVNYFFSIFSWKLSYIFYWSMTECTNTHKIS